MSFPFIANITALLFSLFVGGLLLGTLFAHMKGRDVKAKFSISPAPKPRLQKLRRRFRMLMFGWEFPPFNSGGLGVACLGLVHALAEKDLDITFVMPKRLPSGVPFARMVSADIDAMKSLAGIEGVTIHAINSPVTPYLTNETYLYQAQYADGTPVYGSDLVSEARRYAYLGGRLAAEEPHDIIYAHDWLTFGAGREAKRVSGKPLAVQVHSTEFDRAGGENIDQRIYDLERAGMHAADKIVTVSNRTRQIVAERYGVAMHKIHTVWNGIDDLTAPTASPTMTTARLAALKAAGYKIVLFMGRITIQKGPDYFVRAARRVLDRDPNVLFILAGSGDMERQMMHLAASLDIADKMLFPGFLRGHDQYEAYKLADLFVMPSVSEPFGLTALEAMRLGTPVIVSKQSGVAEAISQDLQVDFWDVDRMSELMISILESPTIHAGAVKRGQNEAAALTWERAAENIRENIVDLLLPAHSFA